jgi:hypothetical protein
MELSSAAEAAGKLVKILSGTAVISTASMELGSSNCLFSWAAKARLPAERKKRARVLNCMLKDVRHRLS